MVKKVRTETTTPAEEAKDLMRAAYLDGMPCDCGARQAAAVIVNRMKIPKCIDCYKAWWTPERLRSIGNDRGK